MKKRKKVERKNILMWIIILIIVIAGAYLLFKPKPKILPGPGGITRSFDKTSAYTNEEITVSLAVDVDSGDRVYSIEETIPADFKVIDTGGMTLTGNKLRYLEDNSTAPLQDTTKTYKVKFSSSGTKAFSGTYIFNSEAQETILGDMQVVIGCREEDLDESGCVGVGEIAAYVNCWLTGCVWAKGNNAVSQLEVTHADDKWLAGITSC